MLFKHIKVKVIQKYKYKKKKLFGKTNVPVLSNNVVKKIFKN